MIAHALLAILVPAPLAATPREGVTERPAPAAPRLSSRFGSRIDPLDRRRAVHSGIDMPGAHGTPILAAAAGQVRVAARRGGYGNLVEIVHDDGSATRYAHLAAILVRAGERVAQGQVIARMGSTGRSTGSHLHFEYRIGGRAVDPIGYLGPAPRSDWRPARAVSRPAAPPHRSRFSRMRTVAPADAAAALPGAGDALRTDR